MTVPPTPRNDATTAADTAARALPATWAALMSGPLREGLVGGLIGGSSSRDPTGFPNSPGRDRGHAGGGPAGTGRTGQLTTADVPRPDGAAVSWTWPSVERTSRRTMASPRPVPPSSRER